MIFYGTRAKAMATEVITDKCPNCGTQGSVQIHVFQQYAHIFWIPVFPTVKKGVSECSHCKQVLKQKEMPSELQLAFKNIKSTIKAPVWMFSGLVILVALIAFTIVDTKNKKEANTKLIANPLPGDILEVKTNGNNYTLFKIDEIQGDSVILRANKYEVDKESGIYKLKIKGDSSYAEEQLLYNKKELKTMFDKGDILDIDRKK
jgi:hypothetical protein